MTSKAELYALLRSNFGAFQEKCFNTLHPGVDFIPNWHLDAMSHALMRCYTGECKKLVITVPPRMGKSLAVSVAYPAFVLGHQPNHKFITASYGQDLSKNMANLMREIMSDEWYQNTFPHTKLSPNKNTETLFKTTANGQRFSTSVGGTLTGMGADTIIIDDPLKASEEPSALQLEDVQNWYCSALYSRLNSMTDGVIIIIMQRLHENDLVGYVLEQEGFEHLNLPAIAEEEQSIALSDNHFHHRQPGDVLDEVRMPQKALESLKELIGPNTFSAQYQQRPMPMGGGVIHWDWFKPFDEIPDRSPGSVIIQSWDTASSIKETACYSACVTALVQGDRVYLLDVYRERLEYPALLDKVKGHAHAFHADFIFIERTNGSDPLIQTLVREASQCIGWLKPTVDKQTRMLSQTQPLYQGKVLLPGQGDWVDMFRNEVVHFPKGKYDDMVDAFSQLLHWFNSNGMSHPTFTGRLGSGLAPMPGDTAPSGERENSRVTLITEESDLSIDDLFNTSLF